MEWFLSWVELLWVELLQLEPLRVAAVMGEGHLVLVVILGAQRRIDGNAWKGIGRLIAPKRGEEVTIRHARPG